MRFTPKTFLPAAVLALSLPCILHAQAILGNWQGTLPKTDPQRIVLKIVKADDGSLHASYYRPGTGTDGTPMSSITFTPPQLEAAQIFASLSFKGKLSADGKSLEGTWTEGKQSYPLTLALATPDTLWKPDYTPESVMAADADPSFDVATIKPSPPETFGKRYGIRTRAFKAVNQSASELIRWSYHLRARQIEGAPAWMDQEHFDIAAKPDLPGQPSEDQYRLMVRKLLAERFGLKTHTTQKVFPVYALTLDKDPPPLAKSDLTVPGYRANLYVKQASDGQLQAQFVFFTMADLAETLMNFMDYRQIVDETGLKGNFDFTIKLPAEIMTGKESQDDVTNEFIHAVQSLGFKLVPKKEPLDVLVIDHIEQPSPN